jgi:DNA invertase Pin-like site-specific DNA recombinase
MYKSDFGRGREGTAKIMRCAVYCRKSTDEGLDQAFNSLDAQYEACASYVASQRHEGWTLNDARYDDGGFSGGTMDRPALKRLLDDVRAGQVDVIVLYKIDRLTRALSDFARIVDILDEAGASFVSVTQSFNTSTSMGRLTLNMLLSFAQFEREIGAERVRDKIAASKAKGMWMGGPVPLGYDVVERKLVINTPEAERVRLIFRRYLALGSVPALIGELESKGIRSKNRKDKPACPFTRGALYTILQNRIYLGEITHKGTSYPGEHEALLAPALFQQAQALLERNRVSRQHGCNAADPSLLAGILWDAQGRRMSPNHAAKQAKRYRYYASRADGNITKPIWRIPAGDIEEIVTSRLCALLRSRSALHDAIEPLAADAVTTEAVLFEGAELERRFTDLPAHGKRATLLSLVERVEVDSNAIRISVNRAALIALSRLKGMSYEESAPLLLTIPVTLARRAREVKLSIPPEPGGTETLVNPALVKLIAKAHAARKALLDDSGRSLKAIAQEQGHEPHYFSVLIKLGYLAPDIVAAILEGRQPAELTRQKLARIREVPVNWSEQRKLLGFAG